MFGGAALLDKVRLSKRGWGAELVARDLIAVDGHRRAPGQQDLLLDEAVADDQGHRRQNQADPDDQDARSPTLALGARQMFARQAWRGLLLGHDLAGAFGSEGDQRQVAGPLY